MSSTLAQERVRRDVDVLSRAGLDSATFLAETYESLQRAVPCDGACVATVDPATRLATGAFKFGAPDGHDATDELWAQLEYCEVESTSFAELSRHSVLSVGMALVTGRRPGRSKRFDALITEALGCSDELRILASDRTELWGGLALFRQGTGSAYSEDTIAFAASLSLALARGLRTGILAAIAADVSAPALSVGPAVMIFDTGGHLVEGTPGASRWFGQPLASGGTLSAQVIHSLLATVSRYASGAAEALPATRIRLATGAWAVLHAAPLAGADGTSARVVLTIDEARPPDVLPLLAAAFELTNRERDIAALILQGADTRAMASTLHLSAHTVLDHVKAIFAKTGVRSRRELLARVFFDQYVPRLGSDLSPTGSFRY